MATPSGAAAPPGKATKSETPAATPGKGPWIKSYRTFCYRLVGSRFERSSDSQELSARLKQAGMDITPGMHRAVLLVTTVIAVIAVLGASTVIFHLLLKSALWYAYVLLLTGITFVAVAGGFRFMVRSATVNRKDQLDRELPFSLSELSVLASTGMSPIQLVRRMAQRQHDPAMTQEFKSVVYLTDIQGKDLITALSETARDCPSTSVRESFWDLANMIHQGGDLDEYLRNKSDDILKLRRLVQHEFIERLTTFLDMYVSLVVVGVLMIAVGAFLINSFGSSIDGLDANTLLLLLTFGLVPVAVTMTILLISIAYSRAE